MQDSLAVAKAFTIHQEEGPQTAPVAGDPGGATNWGITQATLAAWLSRPVEPWEVYALSFEEAADIFQCWYWNACRCQNLWWGLDLMIADHAFNCGTKPSARVLQTLLNVDADGIVGIHTIAGANMVAWTDRTAFLDRLRLAQETDYRKKNDFGRFGEAWLARLTRRHAMGLALLAKYQPQPMSGTAATAPH